MKRLLPSDTHTHVIRQRPTVDGTGTSDLIGKQDTMDSAPADQEPVVRQCALPPDADHRRTALFAIVTGGRDGLLTVRESPIEIVPFRDTDLVHFAYMPAEDTGDEIVVQVTGHTCFDVNHPFSLPDPGTPIIVIGVDLGQVIEAEIIAGMDSEARYRNIVHRYQSRRDWYRSVPAVSRTGDS